jgi:PPP family 3-phenylpropionic acid transporter
MTYPLYSSRPARAATNLRDSGAANDYRDKTLGNRKPIMSRTGTNTAGERRAFGFSARLSLFYAAIFLLVGVHLPYFPVWLDWRGLSAREIGIVLAAPLGVRVFFTPVISFAADRLGNRRFVLILLAWGALASFMLLAASRGFWPVLAITAVAALFWTSIMPLTEAVAMDGVRRAGLDYGRIRLWGSLTFIAASFGGGIVLQHWLAPSALWMMIAAVSCTVLAAHLLPRPVGKGRLRKATTLPQIRIRDALALVRSPVFLLFLLTTGGVQSAHAIYYAFGTIHWRSLDISDGVIGLLWATGVVAEILLFAFSRRALARTGPATLIVLAALAAVLRWAATSLSPPLCLLFPVQTLHGLTFGAAHLAAVHFISEAVPENAAGTAQGLYAAFTAGIAMGTAIAGAGPLYAALGAQAYLVMSGLGLLSLGCALLLRRVWRGGALISLDDR